MRTAIAIEWCTCNFRNVLIGLNAVQHPIRSAFSDPSSSIAYQGMRILAGTGGAAQSILAAANRAGLLRRIMGRGVAHPSCLPDSFYDDLVTGLRPRSFVQAAKNGLGYEPFREWANIDVPTMVTFGDKDRLVPASDQERLKANIPSFDAHVIGDCGHFAPYERPNEVLRLLQQFRGRDEEDGSR